jgi:rubrerythrin
LSSLTPEDIKWLEETWKTREDDGRHFKVEPQQQAVQVQTQPPTPEPKTEGDRAIHNLRSMILKDLEHGAKQKFPDTKSQAALILYLIDRLNIRVGNETSAQEKNTLGATTLDVESLQFQGNNSVGIHFFGKSYVPFDMDSIVLDPNAYAILQKLWAVAKSKGNKARIFGVSADNANDYLKEWGNKPEIGIPKMKAKMIRTYKTSAEMKYFLDDSLHNPQSPRYKKEVVDYIQTMGRQPANKMRSKKEMKRFEYDVIWFNFYYANLKAAQVGNHLNALNEANRVARINKTIKDEQNFLNKDPKAKALFLIERLGEKWRCKACNRIRDGWEVRGVKEGSRWWGNHAPKPCPKCGAGGGTSENGINSAELFAKANLSTSLKNYVDPRIVKSYMDTVGLDWRSVYSKTDAGALEWIEQAKPIGDSYVRG